MLKNQSLSDHHTSFSAALEVKMSFFQHRQKNSIFVGLAQTQDTIKIHFDEMLVMEKKEESGLVKGNTTQLFSSHQAAAINQMKNGCYLTENWKISATKP